MHILIEEHQYPVTIVKDILHGVDALENVEGLVSVHYVGYYYNRLISDCVFILPKVLLQDVGGQELVFGKYRPEEIIHLESQTLLDTVERDFIYKFAVWIYRAIVVYKKSKQCDPALVYHTRIGEVGKGRLRLTNTYLDILLALLRFNQDNQSFFFWIVKNMHSGQNKINWTRTIATSSAVVQDDTPVYLNPVNKRKMVNFDEELLVIFYSILNYISDTFGFPKQIGCQYTLIADKQFETYLKGFGKVRLLQIKYKYFSDKALKLWELCYAFFDESKKILTPTDKREYLLVKNFYTVFEAIVDELIGDTPLPDGMQRRQEDGKIVDHLFTARCLIDSENKQTYYIGDSKYYKMGHELGNESIYKQYTYARNVIQWNLDIFNNGRMSQSGVKLRDEVTEGYNIIPNFFISSKIARTAEGGFDYGDDGIARTDRSKNKHKRVQFPNRLFDRDTMLLFHYDVNFLYILSLYARDNASQKRAWKEKVRNMFRTEIQDWLQKDYDFYAMRARAGVNGEEYVRRNFKSVVGKINAPFDDSSTYSLALDHSDPKNKEENDAIIAELSEYFHIERCQLGQNPNEVLPPITTTEGSKDSDLVLCVTKEGLNYDYAVAKLRECRKIGIALNMNGATLQLVEGFTAARYVVVHNKSDRYVAYYVDGKGPQLVAASEMEDMVVTKRGAALYLVYQIDNTRITDLNDLKFNIITRSGNSYSPHLVRVEDLKSN